MHLARLFISILAILCAIPAAADTLGVGRLFNNDRLGDGGDRWRSGSYMLSVIRGDDWHGRAPEHPGQLLEYRLRTEIISPASLSGRRAPDRPYVGAISAGLHTHWSLRDWDLRAGIDLTATGPSTGLGDFQAGFHRTFSLPSLRVLDTQLPDALHVGVSAEAAHPFPIGSGQLRPFSEIQTGPEQMARIGADLLIGPGHDQALLTRDPVTGQLLRAIAPSDTGVSLALGADWAGVWNSAYLPAPHVAEPSRLRARAGLHWQIAEGVNFFYGATWLSPEYQGQSGGQVVGSLKVNFNF